MSYIIEKTISTPNHIKDKYPINKGLIMQVDKDRKEIVEIIEGRDKRKLLIIGPCSAWPNTAVLEYAKKLKKVSDKVKGKIKIVMRVYTQKPRTTLGWTGPVNQPNPYTISNIEEGIIYCREMMRDVLTIGLPVADEALFTHNEGYFDDILSWIAIGARSSEDQEHRIYASMINHPVGIKNPTSGNIEIGINSVLAAQHTHVFLMNGKQVRTLGNDHAHLVLRGGDGKSNIYMEDLKHTKKVLDEKGVKCKSVIIDCSHDNSIDPSSGKKDPKNQPKALLRVIEHMNEDEQIHKMVKGFMVESFIKEGNQNLNDKKSVEQLDLEGLSVTDACIGFDETEKLIISMFENL